MEKNVIQWMFYINVKEQFDVLFLIKAPIFSQQVNTNTVFWRAHYLFQTLAMLSFSVIICYCATEIGLYSLYRKKVIAAFELN